MLLQQVIFISVNTRGLKLKYFKHCNKTYCITAVVENKASPNLAKEFIIDRPFYFLIEYKPSDLILVWEKVSTEAFDSFISLHLERNEL